MRVVEERLDVTIIFADAAVAKIRTSTVDNVPIVKSDNENNEP